MSIKRTRLEFEDHYTQIPNAWLRDDRLTYKARGMLASLASHRPGWRVSERSMSSENTEGRAAIRTGLAELSTLGYLVREQKRGDRGAFGSTDYILQDPWSDYPTADNPRSDNPRSDNRTTKKTSSKEDYLSENYLKGGQAPPPSRFCVQHPTGSAGKPCGPCGDARHIFEAHQKALAAEASMRPSVELPPRRDISPAECSHKHLGGFCVHCGAEEVAA